MQMLALLIHHYQRVLKSDHPAMSTAMLIVTLVMAANAKAQADLRMTEAFGAFALQMKSGNISYARLSDFVANVCGAVDDAGDVAAVMTAHFLCCIF